MLRSFTTTYGTIEGLPAPEPGVIYVVSLLVLQALPSGRRDVFVPGLLRRDSDGRITGCEGLSR